jgi:membrane protease subunit (stomatin/prohibitin family)
MKTTQDIIEKWYGKSTTWISDAMEEYADQFRNTSEEKLCGECNKFQVDDNNFPDCGLCMTGNYHNAKKKSDVCDNPTNFKKKK